LHTRASTDAPTDDSETCPGLRAVAPEISPRRNNVVSPGSIDTPMAPALGARSSRREQRELMGQHVLPHRFQIGAVRFERLNGRQSDAFVRALLL
jgi:NAD(P)-dependent dehydrogenase (short-subunit alcohol dehydrogenase family)